MQKSRSEFKRRIKIICLTRLSISLQSGLIECPVPNPGGILLDIAEDLAEKITSDVHQNHYPMAPEPEFLEDPTKPPPDLGPGKIV